MRNKKHTNPEPRPHRTNANDEFVWHDIGKGNRFNKRILDIRSLTTRGLPRMPIGIDVTFLSFRYSNGLRHLHATVKPHSRSVLTSLMYPHDGSIRQGVVFTSDRLELMWDIFLYDNIFYFSRSWTGELIYTAKANILPDSIELTSVECAHQEEELAAINNVHFLMMSHVFGKIFPHMIPKGVYREYDIAVYSFALFGEKALYACHEPIVDTVVTPTKSPRPHVSLK